MAIPPATSGSRPPSRRDRTRIRPATIAGDAFASFLLGYPATGDIAVAGPGNFLLNYYAGYVQDEFRATSKLTFNLGLRYEFEDGLRERDNRFTVGFDPDRGVPGAGRRASTSKAA